jgi:hypothetical protein
MITFVLRMVGTVVHRGTALEVICKTMVDVGEKKGVH